MLSLEGLPAALQSFEMRPESPIKRPKPKPKEFPAISVGHVAPVDAIADDLGGDESFEDALEAIIEEDRGEADSGTAEATAGDAGDAIAKHDRERALCEEERHRVEVVRSMNAQDIEDAMRRVFHVDDEGPSEGVDVGAQGPTEIEAQDDLAIAVDIAHFPSRCSSRSILQPRCCSYLVRALHTILASFSPTE